MAAKARRVPDADANTAYNSVAGLFGDWIRQGTEGFVAAQKVFLDLAAQQNALALSIVRERLGFTAPSAKIVADFAGQSVGTLLDVQREVLDLVLRQNSILQAGLKHRLDRTPLGGVAEVLHHSVEHFVAAHQQLIDAIQHQADGALDDFAEGRPFENGRLAELSREAVNKFLEGQKQFLCVLQEQVSVRKHAREKCAADTLDLVEVAKQSVDALVATQRKLLDMVTGQVKANVTFAREVFTFDAHPATLSEVIKKSVESFVAAQKALVDLGAKPRAQSEGKASHAAAA